MGLFDFLKPRKDPLRELEKNPLVKRAMLAMKLEFVQKQIDNLRAVGRDADANKTVLDYLLEILQEWKKEPQNPSHLSLLANAAMSLGALDAGKESLNAVIQANAKTPLLDLTLVYMDLGMIYHQLRNNPEKELWCYNKATESVAPPNCKFPASQNDKTKAHNYAYMCAYRINNEDQTKYHDHKRRELAPDLDFDDPVQVMKWLQ